jgi:DTW domain-containing protein YfiP
MPRLNAQRPIACLCPLIPSLDSRTRVIVLQHPSETSHALKYRAPPAPWAVNAELRVEVFDDLETLLATPGYRPVLLFPGDDAEVLQSLWRRHRRAAAAVDRSRRHLAQGAQDAVPEPAAGGAAAGDARRCDASRYRLRKAPEPGALSTIEAVVQALNVLEGAGRFDPCCDLSRP